MKKYRFWLGGILAITIAGILALTIKDQIRDSIVQPIYYLLSLAILLFDSLPQQLVWRFLILFGIIIYVRSLLFDKTQTRLIMKPAPLYKGHVETWARWIEMAKLGEIFKVKLARELGELAIDTLAHREQLEIKEARQQIRDGKIGVPPEIINLINTKPPESRLFVNPIKNFIQRLNKKGSSPIQDLNLERVFQYLEAELEVNYD
ncbi:MAG: hypothetical protein FVQ83_14815 [Chloroflexi bacterium]|nr:hypothetical protein [Chloroflexota bacterium]